MTTRPSLATNSLATTDELGRLQCELAALRVSRDKFVLAYDELARSTLVEPAAGSGASGHQGIGAAADGLEALSSVSLEARSFIHEAVRLLRIAEKSQRSGRRLRMSGDLPLFDRGELGRGPCPLTAMRRALLGVR